jgi:SP family general alpha glucoside:H+ symporter-like MFS transporter
MTIVLIIRIEIGSLGFVGGIGKSLAIGVLLVVLTLVNMITIGLVCYPVAAQIPYGRLQFKTICICCFSYNLNDFFL